MDSHVIPRPMSDPLCTPFIPMYPFTPLPSKASFATSYAPIFDSASRRVQEVEVEEQQ